MKNILIALIPLFLLIIIQLIIVFKEKGIFHVLFILIASLMLFLWMKYWFDKL